MSTTPYTTVSTYHHCDDGSVSYGGISPSDHTEWTRAVNRYGHAITGEMRASGYREKCRTHDDAIFCEDRTHEFGSMAAYYENGPTLLGRTWITDEKLRRWLADGRVA